MKRVLASKTWTYLTLSWRRLLSYRNQSINLLRKSMDWFLYDNGLRREKLNTVMLFATLLNIKKVFAKSTSWGSVNYFQVHLTVSFLLVISPSDIVTQNSSRFVSKESSPYFTSNIRRIREIRENYKFCDNFRGSRS